MIIKIGVPNGVSNMDSETFKNFCERLAMITDMIVIIDENNVFFKNKREDKNEDCD